MKTKFFSIILFCLLGLSFYSQAQKDRLVPGTLRVGDSLIIAWDNAGNKYILPVGKGSANQILCMAADGGELLQFRGIADIILSDSALFAQLITSLSTDSAFLHNLETLLASDSIFLHNMEALFASDSTFLSNLVDVLSSDSTFLNNLVSTMQNDSAFMSNLVTTMENDSAFMNSLVTTMQNDSAFMSSLVTTMRTDTAFMNNLVSVMSNDSTFLDAFTYTHTTIGNLDSLLVNDSALLALIDSLLLNNWDSMSYFADRWIRNQKYVTDGLDLTSVIQDARATITGPFIVTGTLQSKYFSVTGPGSASVTGTTTLTGAINLKGSIHIGDYSQPDSLSYWLRQTHSSKEGDVLTLNSSIMPGVGKQWTASFKPSGAGAKDSLFFQLCNGCTTDTSWYYSGDTIMIDTAGRSVCAYSYDQITNSLIICGDTTVLTSNGYWMKSVVNNKTNVFPNESSWRVGIGGAVPRTNFEVLGNSFFNGAIHSEGGDGNADGSTGIVNAIDALAVYKYLDGQTPWTDNLFRGDMNGDGVLSLFDAEMIISWFVGKYPSLSATRTAARRLGGTMIFPTLSKGTAVVPVGLWAGMGLSGITLAYPDSIPATAGSGRNVFLANKEAGNSDFSKSFALKFSGKTGIGTDNPSSKLDVRGGIIADSLKLRNIGTTTAVANLGYDIDGNIVTGSAGASGLAWADTTGSPSLATAYDLTQLGAVPANYCIYVDARGGNDATAITGNIAFPFLTIRAAIDAWTASYTIIVLPGTYIVETTSNGGEGLNLVRNSTGTYISPKYYFYPGARVLKPGGAALISDNSAGNISLYIYGKGTFIKNTTTSNADRGCIMAFYTSQFYIEADSIYSSIGGILRGVQGPVNGCFLKANYIGSAVGWMAWVITNINIECQKIIGTNAANLLTDVSSCNIKGNITVTGNYYCIVIRDGTNQTNFTGTFSGYGGVNALTSAGSSMVINLTSFGYVSGYIYNSSWGHCEINGIISGRINCQSGVTVVNSNAVNFQTSYGGFCFTVTAGKLIMNGTSFLNAGNTVSGGVLEINGTIKGGQGCVLEATGGTVYVNGRVDIGLMSNTLLAPITVSGTAKLILNAGGIIKLNDIYNAATTPGALLLYGGSFINNGGIIYTSVGQSPIIIKKITVDSVSVNFMLYSDLYVCDSFACIPNAVSSIVMNTYDFSVNPKYFIISVDGVDLATINLTANCADGYAVVNHVVSQFAAAGLSNFECLVYGQYNRQVIIKYKDKAPDAQNKMRVSFALRGDACSVLGLRETTYVAKFIDKLTSGKSIIFDPNAIFE